MFSQLFTKVDVGDTPAGSWYEIPLVIDESYGKDAPSSIKVPMILLEEGSDIDLECMHLLLAAAVDEDKEALVVPDIMKRTYINSPLFEAGGQGHDYMARNGWIPSDFPTFALLIGPNVERYLLLNDNGDYGMVIYDPLKNLRLVVSK